jgi:hypothetical protein
MIDSLKTLSIEKGKPFNPDARTREILNEAAQEAREWLDIKYEASLDPPFYEGGHWALPANPEMLKECRPSTQIPTAIRWTVAGLLIPWPSSAQSDLRPGPIT